jgi:hypothetical protein
MSIFFEAKVSIAGRATRRDFDTADAAAKFVEENGAGRVVCFTRTPNPNFTEGCAEIWRYEDRSCGMWTLAEREGKLSWMVHGIFDGSGAPLAEERPH